MRLDLTKLELFLQALVSLFSVFCPADQVDDIVKIVDRDLQTGQYVLALVGTLQVVLSAPLDDLEPMFQENFERLFEPEHARFSIDECQHDDAEGAAHRRTLIECSQDLLGITSLRDLEHDTQALAIGFVAQIR